MVFQADIIFVWEQNRRAWFFLLLPMVLGGGPFLDYLTAPDSRQTVCSPAWAWAYSSMA